MQTSQGHCRSPIARRSTSAPPDAKGWHCVSSVGVFGLSVGFAAPAQAADPIVEGRRGTCGGLQSRADTKLARPVYAKLSGAAQVAQLVNIETTVNWSQVAAGSQDADIKRWAQRAQGPRRHGLVLP